MRKQPTDTKATRQLAKDRTIKQIERYQTKLALAETWEKYPKFKAYAEKLRKEADKLRAKLIVKGAL